MARPPKKPEERHTASMKIPLTDAQKRKIQEAASIDGEKPVTWARNVLMRAAKYRRSKRK